MRPIAVAILVVMMCCMAHAKLPKALEEFQTQIAEKASDPKAATKLFFDAVFVYIGGNRELGEQLITEMSRYKDWNKPRSAFVMALRGKPHIFRSYAKGATPENQYKMDPNKYELMFTGKVDNRPFVDKAEGRFAKLFVKSNGADLPRPIAFQRNRRGEYKAYEYSSIYVDVRPPKTAVIFGESIPQSTDPVWTFKHWLQGVLLYLSGEEEDGLKQMFALMKEPDPSLRNFLGSLAPDKQYIWRSYVKGTKVDDGYAVADLENFEVDTYYQRAPGPEDDALTMFVRTTGGNMPRPLGMTRDARGQWRISEFSSLCVGLGKIPKEPEIFGESMPHSTDPAWVFKHWLQGILKYCAGDEEAGKAQMFSLMKEPDPSLRNFLGSLAPDKHYIWRSYVKGTKVDDGYKVADLEDFEVDTYYQRAPGPDDDALTMFVRTTGGNMPRPLGMARDDRKQWRVSEFSSLCVGLSKIPKKPGEDDF